MSALLELDQFLSNLKSPVLEKKISALSAFEQANRDSRQEFESKQLDETIQALIHTVKSPQMNLCLAGLSATGAILYQFEVYYPALLKPYAPLLFPHLLDRLGDSKEKVREGALTELVGLWTPSSTPPEMQNTVQKNHGKATSAVGVYFEKEMKAHGFNHKTWRVREQVLSWVVQCVKTIPDFSLKPYVPFIVKLLEDPHDLVREASKDTLVTLFSSSSLRMRHDLAKELQKNNIRGTIVDSILGKIEANSKTSESSRQASETEPELSQNHSTENGIESKEQDKWESSSFSTTTESDAVPSSEKDNLEPIKASTQPNTTDDHVDMIHVYNSKDLENEFINLAPIFKGKETEDNWESRDRAWQRLRGIVRSDAPTRYQSTMANGLRSSMTLILDTLHSLRTSLALSTLSLVKDLALYLGTMLDPHLDLLLVNLLKLNTQTKKLVAQASFETTCVILRVTSYNHRTTNTIAMSMTDKNVQLRGFIVGYLKVLLETFGGKKEVFEKNHGIDSIENCIRKGVNDASPQVRENSRELFWVFWATWRTRGENLKKSFDSSTQKQLMRLRGQEVAESPRCQTPASATQNPNNRNKPGPRIDITSHDVKGPSKRKANQNEGLLLPKSPIPSKLPSPTSISTISIPRLTSHDGSSLSARFTENSLATAKTMPRSMSSMSFNRRCVSPKPTSPIVAPRRAQTPSLSPPTHKLRSKTPTLSPPSTLRTLRSSTPSLTPPRSSVPRPRSPGVISPIVAGRRTPGIPSPSRPNTPHVTGQRSGSARPMTPGNVGSGLYLNRPNTPQSSLYGRSSTPSRLASPTVSAKSKLPKPTTISRPGTVFSRPTTPQALHPSPPPSSTGSSSPRRRFGTGVPSRLDYQLRKLSVVEQLKHSDHTIRTAGINNLYHMYTSSPNPTDISPPPGSRTDNKSLPSSRVLAPILLALFSDTHPKVIAQLVRTEVIDVMTRIIPLEQLFLAVISQSMSLSSNDDTQINHPALPMLKAVVPEDKALDILCITLQILKTPGGLRNCTPALSNMTTAERKKSVIRVLTWMTEIAEHALIWQNDHVHDEDEDENVFRNKTSIGEKAYLYFSEERNMRHYLSKMLPYLSTVPPTAATYPLLVDLVRKLMQLAPDVFTQVLIECEPSVIDKLECAFGESSLYSSKETYQKESDIEVGERNGGFITGADGKVEELGDDNLLGLRDFDNKDAMRITTTSNILANRLDAIKLELERDEDRFALKLNKNLSPSSNELDYFTSPSNSILQATPVSSEISEVNANQWSDSHISALANRKLSAFKPPEEGVTSPFPSSLSDRYQMVATLISRLGTGNADSFTFRKLIRASRETSTEENPREAHEVWGQHGMFDNVINAILSFLQGPYHPEQKENCLLFVKHLLTNQAAFFQPYVREILNQLMDCRANEWNEVCSAAEDALDTFVMYMEYRIALEATSEWLDKALTIEETNPAAYQAWSSGPNPLATAFDIISRLIRRYAEDETPKLAKDVMPLVIKGFHDSRPEVRKSVVEVVVSLYDVCDQCVIDDSVMPDLTLSQRKLVTSYLELSGSHRFQ